MKAYLRFLDGETSHTYRTISKPDLTFCSIIFPIPARVPVSTARYGSKCVWEITVVPDNYVCKK
jgi:hypothetical protein